MELPELLLLLLLLEELLLVTSLPPWLSTTFAPDESPSTLPLPQAATATPSAAIATI